VGIGDGAGDDEAGTGVIATDAGADCVFQLRCAATAGEGIEQEAQRSWRA